MDEPITRREQYYAGIAEALRNGGGRPVFLCVESALGERERECQRVDDDGLPCGKFVMR